MPPLALPKWAPKDKAAPLKEEYLLFFREVTRYHDRVEGNLEGFPTLASQLPNVPEALDTFTDKVQTIVGALDLIEHLSDVRALYEKAHHRHKRTRSRDPFLRSAADP